MSHDVAVNENALLSLCWVACCVPKEKIAHMDPEVKIILLACYYGTYIFYGESIYINMS